MLRQNSLTFVLLVSKFMANAGVKHNLSDSRLTRLRLVLFTTGCSLDTCTSLDAPTPAPRAPETLVDCGCSTCTAESLAQAATDSTGTFTCRERIAWLLTDMGMTEQGACRRVGLEFPDVCGVSCNPDVCSSPMDCGCPSTCTAEVLNSIAGPEFDGDYSCRARIDWLMDTTSMDMDAACRQASTEFPDICGAGCNPDTCVNTEIQAMLQMSSSMQDGTSGAFPRLLWQSTIVSLGAVAAYLML